MMTPSEVALQMALTWSIRPPWSASVRYGRQQQDAVGAGGFGGLGVFDGLGGGAAGGGQDGNQVAHFLDGGADHALGFRRRQGEAFAGAAGGEESGDREAGLPREVLAVVLLVELQLGIERGHGERQQAFLEGVWQVPGGSTLPRCVLRVAPRRLRQLMCSLPA